MYNVTIKNIEDEFPLTAEMNAVNKDVLLNVPNPNYETMHTNYFHLIEIKMNENQAKHSQWTSSWEHVTLRRSRLKKGLEYDR